MSSREATKELRGHRSSSHACVLNSGVRLCNLSCISPAFLAVGECISTACCMRRLATGGPICTVLPLRSCRNTVVDEAGCRSSQLGIFFYYLLPSCKCFFVAAIGHLEEQRACKKANEK